MPRFPAVVQDSFHGSVAQVRLWNSSLRNSPGGLRRRSSIRSGLPGVLTQSVHYRGCTAKVHLLFSACNPRGVRCDTGDQLRSCLPKVRVQLSTCIERAILLLFMLYSFSFFFWHLGPHLNVASSRSSCAIGVPGVRVCGCGDNSNRVINV